jgi:hypothetical protein
VHQGFLPQLLRFDWDSPLIPPIPRLAEVEHLRTALRMLLWANDHPWLVSLGLIGLLSLLGRRRR